MGSASIVEEAPGIWAIRWSSGAAAYLVKTSPGGVLIDCGPEPSGSSVMYAFQRARVGLRSVRAILLTSAGAESAGGAVVLRERCGSPVFCSKEEAGKLPFEADGRLEIGDVVESRFEVVWSPSRKSGELGFRLRPSGPLFAAGELSWDRTR
jgi:glyoxylase-like metal-dependent hydrolase (beta-lactamase superfamily II)